VQNNNAPWTKGKLPLVLVAFVVSFCLSFFNPAQADLTYRQYVAEINNFPLKKPRRKSWRDAQNTIAEITTHIQKKAAKYCIEINENSNCKSYWSVNLVKSSAFNAYATDGNRIIVYTGLLDQTSDDDEIAFVIAHEIGHHAHNHIIETRNRGMLGAVVGGILGAVSGDVEVTSQMANMGAGIGRLSYSVTQEKEADAFALRLIEDSGYDSAKARKILLRMARMAGSIKTKFLASHPSGPDRLSEFDKIWRKMDAIK